MRCLFLGAALVLGCGASASPPPPPRAPAHVAPAFDEDAELEAIETLIAEDRLAEAEELAAALVARAYTADAFEARGRVRLFREKTDLGLEDLRKAVAMAPREARFRIYLAEGFESADRYDEAMAVARETFRLDPRSGRAMRLLARGYRHRRELEEAQRWLRAAIEVDGEDGDAWRALASAQHLMGQLADAEASAARAAALRPDDAHAWEAYASILYRNGKAEEELVALERAIAVARVGDSRVPSLYRRLGAAYAQLKQYERAIAAMRRYLELAPAEAADHAEVRAYVEELERLGR